MIDSEDVCPGRERCGLDAAGVLYDVMKDDAYAGSRCIVLASAVDSETRADVTPGLVLAAFRRLSWPQAKLVVQPRHGWTLVNLATVFSTPTTGSRTQTVRLLGRRVQIRAHPASYVWIHGDGSRQTTATPGHQVHPGAGVAAQDVDLRGTVNHVYRIEERVLVELDVTYAGSYRVGSGPWVTIPGTLTVAGEPRPLRVRTATPVLVG
ncbi:MAG: hypothetical protein QM638_10770 [Nocardioides sp.]|uniref:hypothetical protein n=1 Tax=Nocardioides sp. TaxID=35761 RepID=UPI0039E4A31A